MLPANRATRRFQDTVDMLRPPKVVRSSSSMIVPQPARRSLKSTALRAVEIAPVANDKRSAKLLSSNGIAGFGLGSSELNPTGGHRSSRLVLELLALLLFDAGER